MSDSNLTPDLASGAPARHRLIDGLLGGVVALAAITVAHAALPDPPKVTRPAPSLAAVRIAAATPAPPPALIAFSQPLPDGEVGSPFGLRELPWEAHARLHAGVDMVAPAPEPVLAAADGVVSRVGTDPGYGRFVELAHADGLKTRYGHLDRFASGLAAGVPVKAGTSLGRLGSTGTSTGVHLHFEIRDAEDRPMNPELFLGKSFATEADLPLRAGRHVSRQARVAYVSRIPRDKQAMMDARLEADAASEAADAGSPSPGATPRGRHRVHMRFRPHAQG